MSCPEPPDWEPPEVYLYLFVFIALGAVVSSWV
jgi:hypothetical protein